MNVTLRVHRQDGPDAPAWIEQFGLECAPQATLLECLESIVADQDPTLCVRDNCFAGVCGECGVRANGRDMLACRLRMDTLRSADGARIEVDVEPLRFHRVIRDLVVDRGDYFARLEQAGAVFAPAIDP